MSSEDNKLTIKLLINKTTSKVVYAEAGKDCVDFLFHILVLPVGATMKHLQPNTVDGSLWNLHKSVEDLNLDLLQTVATKHTLVSPKASAPTAVNVPLWNTNDHIEVGPPISPGVMLYTCPDPTSKVHRTLIGGKSWGVSDAKGSAVCPHCGEPMTESLDLRYVAPQKGAKMSQEGYVKPHVRYMITDDLVVKPLSTNSVLMLLLNNPSVKDMACLQERVVSLDTNQGMALLKASLISKTVLTDTFLRTRVVETNIVHKSSKKLDKLVGSDQKKDRFWRSN